MEVEGVICTLYDTIYDRLVIDRDVFQGNINIYSVYLFSECEDAG